jgi:hypothetical protein
VAVVSAPLSRQACRLHSIEFAAGTLPLQKDKITIRDAESNDAPELAVLMRELGNETKQAEMESRLKLICRTRPTRLLSLLWMAAFAG